MIFIVLFFWDKILVGINMHLLQCGFVGKRVKVWLYMLKISYIPLILLIKFVSSALTNVLVLADH